MLGKYFALFGYLKLNFLFLAYLKNKNAISSFIRHTLIERQL